MDAAEVKKKVDRLAELDRQMVAVKGEWIPHFRRCRSMRER